MRKLLLFFLVPALFAACNMETGDFKYFDYTLRGYWEAPSYPHHTLKITLNTIEIIPYLYYSDVPGLAGYTANVTLEGYSEKVPGTYSPPDHAGSLSIKNGVNWTQVPYQFWTADYDRMLTIGSGSKSTVFKNK